MYEALFTPMNIGTMTVKNRFVVPAMHTNLTDENNQYTEQALRYYAERAKGGYGLISTEFMCVSEEGLADAMQAGIFNDGFIPQLTRLVDLVHANGAKIMAQIQHSGRVRGYAPEGMPVVGASAVPAKGRIQPVHELTTEEVGQMVQKFVDAAVRAQKAGFDAVEVHGAHGYLLAQFLSKDVNKRVDRYGGSISNRARIVCEIVQGIKAACGADYPVVVRTSGKEGYYGGNDIEDAVAHALLFEEAGADALHISHGTAIHPYYSKAGFNIDNFSRVKKAVNIPVIGVGRLNDPALLLSVIKSGAADFVALGRSSICDSHLPEKLQQGRLDEIFICTGCTQRCLMPSNFEPGFYGTSCMMNPFSGKEGVWEITPTETPKKIAVVGAGVAGLQAAWVLAARGHQVKLYEKSSTPGGQYRLACVPTMKQDLARTVSTYVTLGQKYGVEFLYQTEFTAEIAQNEQFDEIVVATGALPFVPRIAGIDGDNVYAANDVLAFKYTFEGKKILVLGAGLVGAETAELLAEYHNQVTIVDMIDRIAPQAPFGPRNALLKHLDDLGVKSQLNSRVVEILPDGIVYQQDKEEHRLTGFDTVITAFGSRPDQRLVQVMDGAKNLHVIGDASAAGDAQKAIFEATKLALEL